MERFLANMDRLYQLYRQQHRELRADEVAVKRWLGYEQPERSWLVELSRGEFETLLAAPTDAPEVAERWIRRIVRGHEHEFTELRAA